MKIEHNTEPLQVRHAGRPRLYEYEKMQVGDRATIDASYNTIFGSINRFVKNEQFKEWKFTIQKVNDKRVRVRRDA